MERTLELDAEVSLGAKVWGDPLAAVRVLAVHGWMDNAASFDRVGPALAAAGCYVVAFDLPGHGMSSHRPRYTFYHGIEYATTIVDVADHLGWDEFVLVGHSLGAGLSSVVAGSFADRVLALVMIDVIGILAWDATALPTHIAQAVAARRKALEAPERGYATLDQAVDRRIATVATYPGKQSLSRDAAARMVARATVTDTSEAGVTTVRFRHDPRIKCPSPGVFTEEQACALLSAIRAPTFFVRGELGWPFKDAQVASRVAAIKAPFETVTLPGSHHLHIDPESAPAVADAIVGFLRRTLPALRVEGAEATAAAAGDAAGHGEGGAAGGGGVSGGFEEAKDEGAGVRPHGHVVRPEDGVLVESEDRL